jgi:hypothetical protein
VTRPNFKTAVVDLFCQATPQNSGIELGALLIECPNQECKAQMFSVTAHHGPVVEQPHRGTSQVHPDRDRKVGIGAFTFLPTTAQPLSKHVPPGVLADYDEAYLISTLSPKASATLARRALQGMVRDFFGVRGRRTLHDELVEIEPKCDPDLYRAMMGVKSVGNIGAHPGRDASLIVDVEPGEPETLLDLIHLLDQEWYVARAERQARIASVQQLAASKKVQKAD